jgi:pimeloyl-ACP methyl ester carboxylesterase
MLPTGRFLATLLILSIAFQQQGSAQTPAKEPAPGVLVTVGSHRMHLRCLGASDSRVTVILEAGGGGFSSHWARVRELLAPSVRSCAYDRAGLGWSEPGPAPRTMRQEVFELHELLDAAQIRGRLVLVGQSIGGLLVRMYAERYDGDVAGMVLVDPTHEDDVLYNLGVARWVRIRDLAKGRPAPEPRREGAASTGHDPAQDYFADELESIHRARIANPVPLGDRPLIVLAAGRRPPPPGTPDTLWRRLRTEKDGQKVDLSRLSRNALFALAPTSTHNIHFDDPALVARAIGLVVDAASKGEALPALFAGGAP